MTINHELYKGFQRLCERNSKLICPTKKELEESGCQISDTFYLVEPSGRVVNPAVVNPDILEDSIKKLFVVKPIELIYETNGKDEFKEVDGVKMPDLRINHTPNDLPVAKYCTHCNTVKPLDSFGKKAGRGGRNRKDVRKECEEKIKAKALEDITALQQHQEEEVKHEESNATPISGEQLKERIKETLTKETSEPSCVNTVGDQPGRNGYVTIEYVKDLVKRAYIEGSEEGYAKGYEDGKQFNIIEPTLAELLGA